MTINYAFFSDFGMTTPLTSLNFARTPDGSQAPEDKVFYLGTPVDARLLLAASNPGVDPILLNVVDSAPGSGVAASAIKLALSQDDLATAVAGAALELGTMGTPNGGGAYACWEIWARITTPLLAEGAYTDLTLVTNNVVEVAE